MPRLSLKSLSAPKARLGYLGSLARLPGGGFVAAGGTYGAATLVHSKTGRTWKALRTPVSSGLRCVLAEDDGAITIVGEYGLHARSRDLGKTWKALAKLDTSDCVFSVNRAPEGERFIVADSGHVYLSSDGGKSVAAGLVRRAPRLFRACFVPGKKGWRTVFLGADGALHWWKEGKVKRQKLAEVPLTQLIVLESGTLLVTGDHGALFRSSDAGKTWKPVKTGTTQSLEDGCAALGGVVLVGGNGTALFSADDGASVAPIKHRATKGGLWSVLPVEDHVLIGADRGEVLELSAG